MISALLLAAGQSRRMGAFKPLLPFGESNVIEACIKNLKNGGVERVVVVLGHRRAELRERLAHLPVSFAINAEPSSEMGVSIARGVERVPHETEAIFIALTDQPAVSSDVVRQLIEERRRTGALIIQPEFEGRGGHPVLLDWSLRDELLRLNPERGLRGMFDARRREVRRVVVASPYVARDMDTWEDYRALHLEIFGSEPPVEP